MRGDLGDVGLSNVFGGLAAVEATGALYLEGPSGPARVFFRDGAVYWAASPAPRGQLGARLVGAGFISEEELEEALEAQAAAPSRPKLGALLVEQGLVSRDVIRVFVQEQVLDAIFELARWQDGSYEFQPGEAVAEDLPVSLSVRHLLIEVQRRQQEWAEIVQVIPSLEHVPDFVAGVGTAQAALEPDEFTLLTSVDGRRSVRELATDLGYSEFEAARLLYGLSLLGVIELRSPARADRALSPAEEVDVGKALEEALFGTYPEPPVAEPVREHEHEVDVAAALEEALGTASGQPTLEDEDLGPPVWSATVDDVDFEPIEPAVEEPRVAWPDAAVEEPAAPAHPGPAVAEPTLEEATASTELEAAVAEEPAAWLEPESVGVEPVEPPAAGGEAAVEEPAAWPEPEPVVDPAVEERTTVDEVSELLAEMGAATDLDEPAPPPSPAPPHAPSPATTQPPAEGGRGDVSEFLRELSWLSGGAPESGGGDERDEESPPPPARPPKKEEERRGGFRRLFGNR